MYNNILKHPNAIDYRYIGRQYTYIKIIIVTKIIIIVYQNDIKLKMNTYKIDTMIVIKRYNTVLA